VSSSQNLWKKEKGEVKFILGRREQKRERRGEERRGEVRRG